MSLSSSFHLLSFQRKVEDALQSVERTLELERKPRLAADVDHTHGAKYRLVNLTSNAAIIAYMNCFKKLGLDAAVLKSIDKTKPATLRFDSSTSYTFLKEVKVDVPLERSYEEKEETKGSVLSKNTIKTKTMKAINHITEFHWEAEIDWSISVYSGTAVEDGKVIKSRRCKFPLITQSRRGLDRGLEPGGVANRSNSPPIELSFSWLLQQIDTTELTSQFKVDTEDDKTKTPRRNDAVQKAADFAAQLLTWCQRIQSSFINKRLQKILQAHNPALPKPHTFTVGHVSEIKDQFSIFNPILPLFMEESVPSGREHGSDEVDSKSIIGLQCSNDDNEEQNTLLSSKDISKLLNEHIRTLEGAVCGIETTWPSDSSESFLSSSEATLSLTISHLIDLSNQYSETMAYIESMMESQLISAIGKRLTSNDVDTFVKYHNAKLLSPTPMPFSHAIYQPNHYPVGLLSIESEGGENECIHSHSREVNMTSSLKIPLSAAIVLQLTGRQYLHGYINHRFGTSHKGHQLIARARQFSSFILVVGNLTDGSTLDPKDAIIVQNKDEVIVSLLLDELPTAKEFKDAVASLSPEQQRFARAYRKMQLASSVFGICVIQIKPQLESLLCLPKDSLDKEMKLTQDLMELFVEFQVPSDLLSYNGVSENVAVDSKVSNVRENVKGVLDVVNAEKEKQLKMEQAKTDMATKQFQRRPAEKMEMEQVVACKKSIRRNKAPSKAESTGIRACSFAPSPDTASCASLCYGLDDELNSLFYDPNDEFDTYDAEAVCFMSLDASVESSLSRNMTRRTNEGKSEMQKQDPFLEGEKKVNAASEKGGQPKLLSDQGIDFTLIPQLLDTAIEKSGEGSTLRSTAIKTGDTWIRNRQANLLTIPERQTLCVDDIKKEKNKAFDLLDALSRSGSLPIAYSELHVIVAVTHCFDKDVMSTVVCDNINPIEKLECSTLLLASTVHGVPARELIRDNDELQRLEGVLPLLLQPSRMVDVDDNVAQS